MPQAALATAFLLALTVFPAAAGPAPSVGEPEPGDVVGEGHIAIGSYTTRVRSLTVLAGVEGVESFRFRDPPEGATIGTVTTDHGGLGFNLDLYFHDASGKYLGGCGRGLVPVPLERAEERCKVPARAASGTVDAVWGLDLHVKVVVLEAP